MNKEGRGMTSGQFQVFGNSVLPPKEAPIRLLGNQRPTRTRNLHRYVHRLPLYSSNNSLN